jgi:branched-chain amino acid transport system substrate-binding protein
MIKSITASAFASIVLIGLMAVSMNGATEMDNGTAGLGNSSDRMIKIGAVYNLIGSQSSLDQPSSLGARLAVKEINLRGGIDGRKIELMLCDGRSDPKQVRKCAEDLIKENVSALMGLSDTDMVVAALEADLAAGIPFVTSGASSPILAEAYDNLFLSCFGDNVQAAAAAEYAYENMSRKTCCLLIDGEMEYARLLAGYFREKYQELGGKIVMEAFINGTDLKSLGIAVADISPDMVYLASGPENAASVVQEIRAAGTSSPVFGGDSFDSSQMRTKGLGRIVFSTHAMVNDGSPMMLEFSKAYQAEYGHPPENAFSALGYDAVNLLADAMMRAGSSDSHLVHKALEETSGFKGVTGVISYKGGSRVPNKGVTMISMVDGEVEDSVIITPTA